MLTETDRRFLAAALRLGQAELGRTWPNPAVGCLIVRDGVVVGAGATGRGGRPHGETRALDEAGAAARDATAYVSLEPCNHHGKTGPCTDALIEAGVARVVIALGDPDSRASGSGVARLREAGIEVAFEPFADVKKVAQRVHRGHITRVAKGRPHVTLKLALSADLGIGRPGEGQVAITSAQTNRLMHGLRARMDAIAVGAGTYQADTPQLTVRLPGLSDRSPQRVLFGGRNAAASWIHLPGHDLKSGLGDLAARGITSLLIEGGAKLAVSFLHDGLVDEVLLIKGEPVMGLKAVRPFVSDPTVEGLSGFSIAGRRQSGPDQIVTYWPTGKA
ncbi:MAG: bifunctional diaminohydroxyphosphoribosylaminopyrimidine deaminase/5-amino-6-(5-phosphoribosylamino)uracil reductase RibD [Rhizobiales bacterium]|nr:bifunctional diaminohydroxyphosphoribosylaminopyrimidine deaminase/5-amino-6-(5-phosphoribosylamino)uracil reductase RibD [Hyphomicrobiales bacterium]MBO6698289.1 bifunctional diaminohydroxyphosphoribosylaminopyrimidine deaminase/5-amino-6-(5-phosphoribosylamino)uracil reductase RibD [Hyphomicrobiales bacterium]MBO6735457.1 bifunctional diaminohydroxyphosphoribosylaminopyrimidine deaminase/5-amino-6-(5-phosphoribosylamino)uracil reductase RibD [Hyphomicrobiales bacterium]MBO6910735.1 bifuncti